jgi:spermidine synthase
MSPSLLLAVVAVSGAAVLALEILGTRVIGPVFGVSLYTWSALITVTLAGLAAGYALGGRVADRSHAPARLAAPLAGAGLWTLLVPLARAPLLAWAEGLGLRTGTLVAATVLFLPPLLLLGMVSPIAVRERARALDEVGRAAGGLWAVSTVASVVAALAMGFVLVPRLGVTRLLVATGIALVLAAAAVARAAPRRGALAAVALLALGALAALPALRPMPHRAPGTVMVAESPYAEVEVRDVRGVRYLLIDGDIHTAVRVEDLQPTQPHLQAMELVTDVFPRGGAALVVGLGGGAAARALTRAGWRVDGVEIDPVVARVAVEHFRVRPGIDARIAVEDGRRFLRREAGPWDAILLDAYGSSSIPFHLCTREAFALARRRLRPGGVLVVNVQSVGWRHPLVLALAATLRTSFAHVVALPQAEPPDQFGNVVLMASERPLDIPDEALGDPVGTLADDYEHSRVVRRRHAWHNRFEPAGGRVFTDDLNPADLWSDDIHVRARLEVRAMFADSTGPAWLGS